MYVGKFTVSFGHLDWQLMGFHDFPKLDLRMEPR